MKYKIMIVGLLLMVGATMHSKTTYIPKYRSYLHIVTGNDTLSVTSNIDTLELVEPNGMFTLRIDHEDVTKEKVKAIKRWKRSAGWATFSAVVGGISTAFSDNSLQYLVRSANTRIAESLADMYTAKAKEEQTLDIYLWIDNTTNGELMICDMERGLTWWILPRQSMQLKLNNPEVSRLRISDSQSSVVHYATAMAGSRVTKWEIDVETDEYWYLPVYKPYEPHSPFSLLHYIRIDKRDFSEEKISTADFKNIKKASQK